MWGQVKAALESRTNGGIIPTRVGTSNRAFSAISYSEDHPHACGDKLFVILLFEITQGSSPRVWGQDADRLYQYDRIRIIPTRVGTSSIGKI